MRPRRLAWLWAAGSLAAACASPEVVSFQPLPSSPPGARAGAGGQAGASAGQAGAAGTAGGNPAGQAGSGGQAAGAAGAAGSGAGGGPGGASSLGPEAYCTLRAQALCERSFACAAPGASQLYDTGAECEDLHRNLCLHAREAPGALPPTAASEACWKGYGAVTCDELYLRQTNQQEGCPLLTGSLPGGAPCVFGDQCTSGLCATALDGCGTCIPPRDAGEDCGSSSECKVGLICSRFGLCERPLEQGESCGAGDTCQATLYCDAYCKPAAHLGEPCDASQKNRFASCIGRTYCDVATKTCVPFGIAEKAGESCGILDVSRLVVCRGGLTCQFPPASYEGTCVEAPSEGQPCNPYSNLFSMSCATAELECIQGTCARIKALDPASCQ